MKHSRGKVCLIVYIVWQREEASEGASERGREEEEWKESQGCHFMSGFEVNKIEIGPKWLQSEVPGPPRRRCLPAVHSSARQRRSITPSSRHGLNPIPALIVSWPPPPLTPSR